MQFQYGCQAYIVAHLEKYGQHTRLRIAEAFAEELKLNDRWIIFPQLGHWNATELL